VANLPKEFRKAQELILTQQTKNQRISARAARLAMEVEKKSAIIRHLRDGRKHSNWLRSLLGALPKTFQRRSKKMRKTDLKEIDRLAASPTKSNQSTEVDGRT
jgi:DNA-binding HxlR family transcriptional regulator